MPQHMRVVGLGGQSSPLMMSWHSCGNQTAPCRSWFSLSTMWVNILGCTPECGKARQSSEHRDLGKKKTAVLALIWERDPLGSVPPVPALHTLVPVSCGCENLRVHFSYRSGPCLQTLEVGWVFLRALSPTSAAVL